MTITVGQAFKFFDSLTLTADVVAPRDGAIFPAFGVEWRLPMTAGLTGALRGGYDGRGRAAQIGGFSFGGGLGFERLGFDYAWTPAGDLGDVQRLSVSYRF